MLLSFLFEKNLLTSLLYNENPNIHPELPRFCPQEVPTTRFKHKLLFRTMKLEKGELSDTSKSLGTSYIYLPERNI